MAQNCGGEDSFNTQQTANVPSRRRPYCQNIDGGPIILKKKWRLKKNAYMISPKNSKI